ncbi:hypothetical protein JCM8208_005015 [Rhodotorula glutinis]
MKSNDNDLAARTKDLSLGSSSNLNVAPRTRRPVRSIQRGRATLVETLELLEDAWLHLPKGSSIETEATFNRPTTYSQQPLSALKPIGYDDMLLDEPKTHRGHYLLCRTVAAPVLTDSLIFGVEDQNGATNLLFVHNYPLYDKHDVAPLDAASLAVLFPPGTGLVVREPTVSRFQGDSLTVSVISPTDVEVYRPDAAALSEVEWATASPFRPSSTSCAELRALADKARTKRACAVAVKRMTDALALAETPADMAAAALHRALVCLDTQ